MAYPVLSWYNKTQKISLDLVGDYAGQELFLIEGDSLLYYCFKDKRIDFNSGIQVLHATYVVERFLENLVKKNCNFHIVFFEENSNLCIPTGTTAVNRSRYLLARYLIRRHLEANLPKCHVSVKVVSFTGLNCIQFEKFLSKSPVDFMMTHDGSDSNDIIGDGTSPREPSQTLKHQFLTMIFKLNRRKLNVALINKIDFRDSKIFTTIIESSSIRSKIDLPEDSALKVDYQFVKAELSSDFAPDQSKNLSLNDLDEFIKRNTSINMCEDYYSTICVVSKMLRDKNCDMVLTSAFLLHTILLKHIPLTQRRFSRVTFNEPLERKTSVFLNNVCKDLQIFLENPHWDRKMAEKQIRIGSVDMIDGRLYRVVLQAINKNSLQISTSSHIYRDWVILVNLINQVTDHKFLYSFENFKNSERIISFTPQDRRDLVIEGEDFGLLPFSNKIINKYFEGTQYDTTRNLPTRSGDLKIYRESNYWKKYKSLSNISSKPALASNKWKNPLRKNQIYMKEMTMYAASLTVGQGSILKPETITVASKKGVKNSMLESKAPNKEGHTHSCTKKNTRALSKRDQLIASNTKRLGENSRQKSLDSWRMQRKYLDIIIDNQDRYLKTNFYLKNLDSIKLTYLQWEIEMYNLQTLLKWWALYCNSEVKQKGYHVAAMIWKTIRSIQKLKSPAPQEARQNVIKVCSMLKITDVLTDFQPSITNENLSFNFKVPICSKTLEIGIDQKEFQLNYCGLYMDRILDAKPDSRVPNFIPDGWQRRVLDQLDANKSVFVVAPTSSGKTFISFYAMEKILRDDDDGVLVYVAPTKALVNQIAAEIQGRFSKQYQAPGKSVWAIYTRDYRINNVTNCQILVTVPHILQIMLLSPSNARSWAPRVRRIIFDEVHSIGQAEDGLIWEQLLLLAPCPIIALSATVGNPEQFYEWLRQVQKQNGIGIEMIQHKTRYCDLRKFIFDPPKNYQFLGFKKTDEIGLGLDDLEGFSIIHPVACLIDRFHGIPDDLTLEPKDCLALWKAMCVAQNISYRVSDSLDPKNALPAYVKKKHIIKWESELKILLNKWMKDIYSPFDRVMEILNGPDLSRTKEQRCIPNYSPQQEPEIIDSQSLEQTTLPLLCQLRKRNALPAILFNYNRISCEKIAGAVFEQLFEAELKWKEGPSWKKTMEGYEKWKKNKSKKPTARPRNKKKDHDEDGGSKLDRMRNEAEINFSTYDLFHPNDPLDDFSFANFKHTTKAELDKFIIGLQERRVSTTLINLLTRGIGVHHSGLNRKYRQCVEILFRREFLGAVIATGTLSMGINMPCPTVVFNGDSLLLTALNFRQASGRAGRRGFDLIGNVVFQGFSKDRAHRLLSSRLPNLTGHFPLTTSLFLRLFVLLNESENSEYAEKLLNSLLTQPRLCLNGNFFKEQVQHHLRFSIEYLQVNGLLGPAGEPINFASAVTRLYYSENSIFAFNEDQTEVEKIKRSPSNVYLSPMPEKALNILQNQNKITLKTFARYVKSFAAKNINRDENKLPLTRITVGPILKIENENESNLNNPCSQINGKKAEENDTSTHNLPSLQTPKARSVFFALSGHGDDFESIHDLCSSTCEGVHLEPSVVPHLVIHPQESNTPLNSYLLDFFNHGAVEPLVLENGLKKEDIWFLLYDFSIVLGTINTSLAIYLGVENATEDSDVFDTSECIDSDENGNEKLSIAVTDMDIESSSLDTNKVGNLISRQLEKDRPRKILQSRDTDDQNNFLISEGRENESIITSDDTSKSKKLDELTFIKLRNVYTAFKLLKIEFDAKFKEIWA
ncbi:putative helicase [Golovinomyces cichoracearum]|uniref:Putative helicase n=1 Tax=Golovinomyces cichoracearum TaxID=62708 RepID=A0A420IGA9_9PEZI|nr:putative helicase [Golovinomyces cichoracearum]